MSSVAKNSNVDFYLYRLIMNGEMICRLLFTKIRQVTYPAGTSVDIKLTNGGSIKCPGPLENIYFANLGIPTFRIDIYCVNADKEYMPRFGKIYDPYKSFDWVEAGNVSCVNIN